MCIRDRVTSTQPLFACDAAGDVFTAAFVSSADGSHGTFEVDRVSSTGKNSSWTLSLTGHAVDSREPGTPPRIVFDVPEVTALLPDAAAGVWVLDNAGPTSGGQAQSYPSIWRPALDP